MTHYEVLGVGRDASPAQIRDAFRRLARAHHPDTSSTGSADAMAPINEAWRVLGDPASRRAYDRTLDIVEPPPSTPPVNEAWVTTAAVPPANFPWRFLLGLALVGIAIVILGVFTYQPSTPRPPDNLLESGSCVVIEENGDATEVPCETDHDGVVENMLTGDEVCTPPLEPHRDSQGLGVVCVRFEV